MKVKMDLHTHIWEASGCVPPSIDVVEQVILQIEAQGIDGIGITDHHNKDYAFAFKEIADAHFPGRAIILPGWEINVRPPSSPFDEYHMGEIFLPGGKVFRSYNHPGYYTQNIIIEDGIRAIEISNPGHNWHIRRAQVEAIAQEHSLLLLSSSDAHTLEKVGVSYTEIDLEDMYARAECQEPDGLSPSTGGPDGGP